MQKKYLTNCKDIHEEYNDSNIKYCDNQSINFI